MTRTKWALAVASAAVAGFGGFVLSGCSSSSSEGGGGDAGGDATLYDAPVGLGVPECTPASCPAPGICGGTLLGPSMPVSYCTVACKTDSDCPAGSGCDLKVTGMHCLKKCTSDSDCSGGFACHLDAGTSGYLCWSPYNGADPGPDAGGGHDSGQSEAAAEAGGNDAAPAEAGGPDGGASDASDGAVDDATSDAASDAPTG